MSATHHRLNLRTNTNTVEIKSDINVQKRRKSIFQEAGHRFSTLFGHPTVEPRVPESTKTVTGLTFKKFRSNKKFPPNTKLGHVEILTNAAILDSSRGDKPSSKKPHGISIKEWFAVNGNVYLDHLFNYTMLFYSLYNV